MTAALTQPQVPSREGEAWQLVPHEPTFEQLDRALHDLGTPNPKESKQWLREFYRAMVRNAKEDRDAWDAISQSKVEFFKTLRELRALSEKATPGPWVHNQVGETNTAGDQYDWIGDAPSGRHKKIIAQRGSFYGGRQDFAFVTAAANFVRQLLASPSEGEIAADAGLVAGLEQLLRAIHENDPKRELILRVSDLISETVSGALARASSRDGGQD